MRNPWAVNASRGEVGDMRVIRAAVVPANRAACAGIGLHHCRGDARTTRRVGLQHDSGRACRWSLAVAAAIALALPLAGCGHFGRWDPPPVGTCVRASDQGEVVVSCAEPHTHRVIAIVPGEGGACPPETVMWATPADPHDVQVTVCYGADVRGE
jgi:hypothetical protein